MWPQLAYSDMLGLIKEFHEGQTKICLLDWYQLSSIMANINSINCISVGRKSLPVWGGSDSECKFLVTIKLVDWEEVFGRELPSGPAIFWASCSQYKDCAGRPILELSTLCLTVHYNAHFECHC